MLLDLLDLGDDLAGVHRLAVDAAKMQDRTGPFDDALNFEIHLPEVQFGNDNTLDLLAESGNALLGERPEGDRTEETGLDPFLTQLVDRVAGRAAGGTVGKDQHFGVVGQVLFVQLDIGAGSLRLDFTHLAAFFSIDILGFGGGEAVLSLVQTCDMEAVVRAKGSQWRNITKGGVVRLVLLRRNGRFGAVDDFELARLGELDAL